MCLVCIIIIMHNIMYSHIQATCTAIILIFINRHRTYNVILYKLVAKGFVGSDISIYISHCY